MMLVKYTWHPHDRQPIEMAGAFEDFDSFKRFKEHNECYGDSRRARKIVVNSMRKLTDEEERRLTREFKP